MSVVTSRSCTVESPWEHSENRWPGQISGFQDGGQKYSFFKSAANDPESPPTRIKGKIL